MKYTRLEIYKGISNSKLKIILGFFIVIPVIAVLSGNIITKIFISNEKPQNLPQNEDKLVIASSDNTRINYKVYFLQAGAFISKTNADSLKTAIGKDDINPVVVEDDTIYRVIIDVSDNKDFITQKRDKLQTLGYNCLVNEFSFASIEQAENEEIERTNKFLNTCIEMIKFQINTYAAFGKSEAVSLEKQAELVTALNENYAELQKLNASTILEKFKSSFEQFSIDYKKGYEAKDLNLCQRSTGQQVMLLSKFYKEIIQVIVK